jgi:hypothetical protein
MEEEGTLPVVLFDESMSCTDCVMNMSADPPKITGVVDDDGSVVALTGGRRNVQKHESRSATSTTASSSDFDSAPLTRT